MRYLIFFLFIIFSSNLNASVKNEIKKNLEKTDNVYFKFIQKINNKTEKGECKLLYPKKIYCKYDDIYEKVMVSNGRSLLINSKKIKNYLNYKLKDTPLDLILDKITLSASFLCNICALVYFLINEVLRYIRHRNNINHAAE